MDNIKKAIQEDRLKMALDQIKAYRACNASVEGKQKADGLTNLIFLRIKELEIEFHDKREQMITSAQVAEQRKELALLALQKLDHEKAQALKAQQTLKEESNKAKDAVLEKNKILEINRVLDQITIQQSLGQKKIIENQYEEAIHIFQTEIERILDLNIKDEALNYKLQLLQQDLEKAVLKKNKNSAFNAYVAKGDSLFNTNQSYFEISKWYDKARLLQIDSSTIFSKFTQIENSLTKKKIQNLKWPLFDSVLIASAHTNSYLNNLRLMRKRLDKYLMLSPKSFTTDDLSVLQYVKNGYTKRVRFETSMSASVYNPTFRSAYATLKFRGKETQIDYSNAIVPVNYSWVVHFTPKISVRASIEYGIGFKHAVKNNIHENPNGMLQSASLSLFLQHSLWSFYRSKKSYKLLEVQGLFGLSFSAFANQGYFGLILDDSIVNPIDKYTNTTTDDENSYVFISDYAGVGLDYFENSWQKINVALNDGYLEYISAHIGLKTNFYPFYKSPFYPFLTIQYNWGRSVYPYATRGRSVTANLGELIYQEILGEVKKEISEDEKQELYKFYQSCDCEVSFEESMKRITNGVSLILGIGFRF